MRSKTLAASNLGVHMRGAIEAIKNNPHFANPPVVCIIENAPGLGTRF